MPKRYDTLENPRNRVKSTVSGLFIFADISQISYVQIVLYSNSIFVQAYRLYINSNFFCKNS